MLQIDGTEGQVNKMSDDLISRRTIKSLIEVIRDCWAISPYVSANDMKLYLKVFNVVLNKISNCPTAFDKEKVIEELRSYEKASYNTGIARAYSGLDNKASEYYQKSRAYHRAIEIVERGGIEWA